MRRSLAVLSSVVCLGMCLHGANDPFIGTWVPNDSKSSMPGVITIEALGSDGLSFFFSGDKARTDLRFDGKPYPDRGPTVQKGRTSTGKRMDAHTMQMVTKINDKSVWEDDFKVSADGQTLTDTQRLLTDMGRSHKGAEHTTIYHRK
jgi:hypothetical protein